MPLRWTMRHLSITIYMFHRIKYKYYYILQIHVHISYQPQYAVHIKFILWKDIPRALPFPLLSSLLNKIATKLYVHQQMCWLYTILILPVGGSASSSLSVAILMKNSYLEEFLETTILRFLNIGCYDNTVNHSWILGEIPSHFINIHFLCYY
jgi:hypothetical protein